MQRFGPQSSAKSSSGSKTQKEGKRDAAPEATLPDIGRRQSSADDSSGGPRRPPTAAAETQSSSPATPASGNSARGKPQQQKPPARVPQLPTLEPKERAERTGPPSQPVSGRPPASSAPPGNSARDSDTATSAAPCAPIAEPKSQPRRRASNSALDEVTSTSAASASAAPVDAKTVSSDGTDQPFADRPPSIELGRRATLSGDNAQKNGANPPGISFVKCETTTSQDNNNNNGPAQGIVALLGASDTPMNGNHHGSGEKRRASFVTASKTPKSGADLAAMSNSTSTNPNNNRLTSQQVRLVELTRHMSNEMIEDILYIAANPETLSDTASTLPPKSQSSSQQGGGVKPWEDGMSEAGAKSFKKNQSRLWGMSNRVRESPIAPFVPSLALRSFQLTMQDEPVCVPCTVQAALLFVDISGYSAVSKALEHAGPYALFDAVNGYISRLLDVVCGTFKGEVLKFAGDAVICIWYGANLGKSVKAASHCAMEMQRRCGVHEVKGTDLSLRVHIGLTCGTIDSVVLRSSLVRYMEAHFHFISGEPVRELDAAVEAARPEEVCVTKSFLSHCCTGADIMPVAGKRNVMRIDALPENCGCVWGKLIAKEQRQAAAAAAAAAAAEEASNGAPTVAHTDGPPSTAAAGGIVASTAEGDDADDAASQGSSMADLDDVEEEDEWVEDTEHRQENTEKFIHPGVRRKLKQGLMQSQLAEMRLLTVLFVKKTDESIAVADWFTEVQRVIDDFRCPILQIIDDDKGVHLVAAINLFTADREPAVTGIELSKALMSRQAGCAIGLASGVALCGVVGNSHASRWDVTGEVCVRACRLMQLADKRGEPVVVDHSIAIDAGDESLLVPMGTCVVKGSPIPLPIYGINPADMSILSSIVSATRMCADVHVEQVEYITKHVINDKFKQRHAVIIYGCGGSGKVSVSVRSVFRTGVVPLLHSTVDNSPTLDVAGTLAKWFCHHKNDLIAEASQKVLDALKIEHNIRATTLALDLLNLTVAKGLKTALVVRQAQSLDAASMSFLRQAVEEMTEGKGRFLVFLCTVPNFGLMSPATMKANFKTESTMVEVSALNEREASALTNFCFGWKVDPRLLRAVVTKSGGVARCVAKLATHILSAEPPICHVSAAGSVSAASRPIRELLAKSWTLISPSVSSVAAQRMDSLSTSARMVLKVIACLSTPYAPVTMGLVIALVTRMLSTSSPATVRKDIALLEDIDVLCRVELDKFSELAGTSINAEDPATATPRLPDEAISSLAEVSIMSPDGLSREIAVQTVPAPGVDMSPDPIASSGSSKPSFITRHVSSSSGIVAGAGTRRKSKSARRSYFSDEFDFEGFRIVNPTLHDVVASATLSEQRRQVAKMAATLVIEEHETALPAYLFAFAHFNFHGGNKDMFTKLVHQGWAALHAAVDIEPENKRAIREYVAQDLFEKGLTFEDVGIDFTQLDGSTRFTTGDLAPRPSVDDDGDYDGDIDPTTTSRASSQRLSIEHRGSTVPSGNASMSSTATIGYSAARPAPDAVHPAVIGCRRYLAPLAFGALTMGLKLSAACLSNLAVAAAAGRKHDAAEVDKALTVVKGYCKHVQKLDRWIGYRPIIADEWPLFQGWLVDTGDVDAATEHCSAFLEYSESIVRRRVERCFDYLKRTMAVPKCPPNAVWMGADREALEKAMQNTLSTWANGEMESVHDGLMELATQGWIPVNPDLSVEFQRDVYIRKRLQPPFCFICFLFCNLTLTKASP